MSSSQQLNGLKLVEQLDIADVSILPASVQDKLNINHNYRIINGQERDDVILSVISSLQLNKFRVSGENDNTVWEKGWGEVLTTVKNTTQFTPNTLIPQYFNKEAVYRLFGDYVISDSADFAYDIDQIIRSLIFSKYLINHKRIVEIGSGTGNSQYLLAQMCPATTELVGSDWATPSLELLNTISQNLNRPITPVLFNMLTLEGYSNLKIDSDTAVFTVHTLEQLGKSYKPLLDHLLESKPAICVHAEPIKELYEQGNLMDYLAIKYHEIRNYLDGWLSELRDLESKNKIKILEEKRIQFGNKYHEAYNLIVWQPC
jgi:SAM-dependent methyltransferase